MVVIYVCFQFSHKAFEVQLYNVASYIEILKITFKKQPRRPFFFPKIFLAKKNIAVLNVFLMK